MIKFKDLKEGYTFQTPAYSDLLNDNVPYLKVYDGRINLRTFEFIKDIENLLNESVYLLKGELKLERIILKEGD
jgi:hypothetical protein